MPKGRAVRTRVVLLAVFEHQERRAEWPRASEVGLTEPEALALVHRGLVALHEHGRVCLTGAGIERIRMGDGTD